jgi:uncharacterized protein YpbB
VIVSVTPRKALFLVGGQLRRSRSAQAVSDAQITNRIRVFFMFAQANLQSFQQRHTKLKMAKRLVP